MTKGIVQLAAREAHLKRLVRRHLSNLGFRRGEDGRLLPPNLDKETYRRFHQGARDEKLAANQAWLAKNQRRLLKWFADGATIVPSRIAPEIELIDGGTWQSDLFRMASLYWQVPVSDGYGRRMRFLVWDRAHEKLIGIFALGDAVFNQAARDEFIGWDHTRRSDSLVNLMDAYVLGALPPYSWILGGKLVASLIRSRDVVKAFDRRYGDSIGLISKQKKRARLVAVTTTSALGRSSIYNRLQLSGHKIFEPIGFTSGFGHFHFSGKVFDELRDYLEFLGDEYADGFRFGSGPNWRIRVIRKALHLLGMDASLTRHGFVREVFFSKIAKNAEAYLRGDQTRIMYGDLPKTRDVASAALGRWVIPRSERDPRFRDWVTSDLLSAIEGKTSRAHYRMVTANGLGS